MRKFVFKAILALLTFLSFQVFSLESFLDSKSQAEIVYVLTKWPQDFNAKNIQAVCGLFAPDLVASYQGSPDKNYEEMCRNLKAALESSEKQYSYKEPEIEQIIVEGNLAAVRLIWTLSIAEKNRPDVVIKEKGLDIFKRQPDGSWKIAISYAYPLPSNESKQ